ncbi:MAG: ABC transporter permease [Ruminococcus sp.]|nr:ABC transporter permease [Ruminococcus sp.]
MNRVLRKRILRELKGSFTKYIALMLLITLGMYIVVSMELMVMTTVEGTAEHGEQNCVEDGQFSVFIPLTDAQLDELNDSGFTIEKIFSVDVDAADKTKLRMMKVRKSVDKIELDEGDLPSKSNECVLEKLYAQVHGLETGDTITAAGREFKIVGTGSVPDYEAPLENLSDTSASSESFGVIFVSDECYELIKGEETQKAESYTYSYLLNGGSSDKLKKMLENFEFDYTDVTDEYFLDYISQSLEGRSDIEAAIDELSEAVNELSDGLGEISGAQGELTDGLNEISSQLASVAALLGDNEQLSAAALTLSQATEGAYSTSKKISTASNDIYSGSKELAEAAEEFKNEANELLDEIFALDITNLTSFIESEDNARIAAAALDAETNEDIILLAGIIVMVLFTYMISIFVIHQIQRESTVIGSLYALGANKRDIISHYLALPTMVTLLGAIAGTILSFTPIGLDFQMASSYEYYSLPTLDAVYTPFLFIYALVMPPVIAVIVNYLVISRKLSKTALSLIRNDQKKRSYSQMKIKSKSFLRSFRIRQLLREARTSVAIILAMILSMLILMMALDSYVLCQNIKSESQRDTLYEYMYSIKYPEESVPDGAEACYALSLSKAAYGNTLEVSVLGIENSNRYFPTVNIHEGKSAITASSAAAQKYGLKVGDKIILTDETNGTDYAFSVEEIAEYGASLTVFMDIDSMRELFGEDESYYNCVLSDDELDIDEGRLYSVTTKADIERSSSVFADLMMSMVIMLSTASVIIIFIVMYIMQSIMIDRSSFPISLMKTFGYTTKEIKKMYINGNLYTIILGALISIPLSKLCMDAMYPSMIANVACGMNLTFPWYYYPLIFVLVIVFYAVSNILLIKKLNKITPAQVIKNRE